MTRATDRPDRPGSREARLAEALRANLRRRKAQARARRSDDDRPENASSDPQDRPARPGDETR